MTAQDRLIEMAVARVRQMYPARVAGAVVDQLTGWWALREQAEVFRTDAIALAEEIVSSPNYSDPDALARVVADAMEVTDPERPRERVIADRVWQFDRRATTPEARRVRLQRAWEQASGTPVNTGSILILPALERNRSAPMGTPGVR